MSRRLRSWSYSTYKTWKTCPRKVKLSKIDGIKEPGSPATERGEAIHKEAELYIAEHQTIMPESLKSLAAQFQELWERGAEVHPEEEWAVNRDWQFTGWDAKDTWLRAKLDAYYVEGSTLTLIDYKTGKVYPDHAGQVALYALLGFLKFNHVETVNVQLWYLDQGFIKEDSFDLEEVPDMLKQWEYAVANMLVDEEFAPRPGPYCRWCFYSKAKNGNCEF